MHPPHDDSQRQDEDDSWDNYNPTNTRHRRRQDDEDEEDDGHVAFPRHNDDDSNQKNKTFHYNWRHSSLWSSLTLSYCWFTFRRLSLPLLCATAIATSLWSLDHSTSIWMAASTALIVSLSVLVLYQRHQLRERLQQTSSPSPSFDQISTGPSNTKTLGPMPTSIRGWRRRANHQRHMAHQLRSQNERLHRRLLQLDAKAERLRELQHQILAYHSQTRHNTATDLTNDEQVVQEWITTVTDHKYVHQQLKGLLQHKLQERILQTVVLGQSTSNNKETAYGDDHERWLGVDPVALERLVGAFQSTPGLVRVNERVLRECLVDKVPATKQSTSIPQQQVAVLANVVQLLRQVAVDAAVQQPLNGATTGLGHRTTPVRQAWSPSRRTSSASLSSASSNGNRTTVFEMDTKRLLRPTPPSNDNLEATTITKGNDVATEANLNEPKIGTETRGVDETRKPEASSSAILETPQDLLS